MKANNQDVAKGTGKHGIDKMGVGEIDLREGRPLQIGLPHGHLRKVSATQVPS